MPTCIPLAGMEAIQHLLGYSFVHPDYVQTILLAEGQPDDTLRRLDLMGDRVVGVLAADLVDRLRLPLEDVHVLTNRLEGNVYLHLMFECIWQTCYDALPAGQWPWVQHAEARAGDKVEAMFGLMYLEQDRQITPVIHDAFERLHRKVQTRLNGCLRSRWKYVRIGPSPDTNALQQAAE